MSSWGLLKSGLGWSATQATTATPSTSTAAQASTNQSTSELLPTAAMDIGSFGTAEVEDDTIRLLRWEAEAQQVDQNQSEVLHQQWRLFREQVATLSGKTISLSGEVKDLYRRANQEETERQASVESVQAAVRASEERILGMLEDICRNQVSSMAVDMERAERINSFKKVAEELEAERSARLGACGEIASDFSTLKGMLEEGLQKSANFMNVYPSTIETRMRETDFAVQQSIKHLEGQLDARHVGERSLADKLEQQCSTIEKHMREIDFAVQQSNKHLQGQLEARHVGERSLADKLEQQCSTFEKHMREIDSAMQQSNKHLQGQLDARSAGEKSLEDKLEQRCSTIESHIREMDVAVRQSIKHIEGQLEAGHVGERAREEKCSTMETRIRETDFALRQSIKNLEGQLEAEIAREKTLEEKLVELRTLQVENVSKSEIAAVRKELERETMERIKADRELGDAEGQIKTELQALRSELKQELAERANGDKNCLDALKQGLEQELAERVKADRKCLDALKEGLEHELAERVKADETCRDSLRQGFDKSSSEREEIKLMIEALAKTLSKDYSLLLDKRIGQTEALTRSLLGEEAKARASAHVELDSKMQSELIGHFQSELERMSACLERETAARVAGDKDTVKQQFMESVAQEVTSIKADLQKQLAQEAKMRLAGDEQMGKVLAQGLEKAGSERSEILRMAENIEAKTIERVNVMDNALREAATDLRRQLEQEVKVRIEGDEQNGKLFIQGLEKAGSERSKILRMAESIETKTTERVQALENELRETSNGLQQQLQQQAKARLDGDGRMGKLFTEGLEKADSERSKILRMAESIEIKTTERVHAVENTLRETASSLQQQLELVTEGLEKAGCERSKILRLAESIETKNTERTKVLENALREAASGLQQKLEQEAKVRRDGDGQMGKLLTEGLEKADSERSKIFRMVESIETKTTERTKLVENSLREATVGLQQKLEQEAKVRLDGDGQMGKLFKEGLEKADSERSRIFRMVDNLEAKIAESAMVVDNGLRAASLEATHLQQQLEQEAKVRIEGDMRMGKLVEDGLEKASRERTDILRMAEGIEGNTTERIQVVENALREAKVELHQQFEKEVQVRILGDEHMGKLLTEGLENAGSERSKLRHMVESIEVKTIKNNTVLESALREATTGLKQQLEQEKKVRVDNYENMGKLLTEGLEKAGSERSKIVRMAESIEARTAQSVEAVENSLREFKSGLKQQLDQEAKVRVAGDEQMDRFLKEGLEKACSERSNILRMAESIEAKTIERFQAVENALGQATSGWQQQLGQEAKGRLDGDEQMGKLIAEGFEKAGRERSEMLRMVQSIEAKTTESTKVADNALREATTVFQQQLEQEANVRVEGDQQMVKLLTNRLEEATRRQSEITVMVDNSEGKIMQMCRGMLEDEVKVRVQGEITQLKFDQDLVIQKLQLDCDTLRRQQDELAADHWKEEVRRVWEAIDGHTHNVDVTDFEEREEPTRNVVRREIVREAPRLQTSLTQSTQSSCQLSERSGAATVPVPIRAPVASNSAKALTNVNNTVAVRAATRMASPPRSPKRSGGLGSPAPQIRQVRTMTPPLPTRTPPVPMSWPAPPQKARATWSSTNHRASVQDTQVSAVAVNMPAGVILRDGSPGSPNLTHGRLTRSSHDLRSNGSTVAPCTVTERTEEIIVQPGKIHHRLEALVGKAVFRHTSDLDPETKRDQTGLSNTNDVSQRSISS